MPDLAIETMTPTDPIKRLAQDIHKRMCGSQNSSDDDACIKFLEPLLAEAIKEARREGKEILKLNFKYWTDTAAKYAHDSALEEAAQLAEDFVMSDGDHGNEIAKAIRALKDKP